jgi:predicted transcriptional regulator
MLLTVGGFQVPVIPLGETLLKLGAGSPEHIEKSEKSGSIGPIEILNVVVFAQGNNIRSGVKVYVVVPIVEVSTEKGLQVPVIGGVLVDVVGKTVGVSFKQ